MMLNIRMHVNSICDQIYVCTCILKCMVNEVSFLDYLREHMQLESRTEQLPNNTYIIMEASA